MRDPKGVAVLAATGADPDAFREALFAALRRGDQRAEPFTVATVMRVEAGAGTCAAELVPPDGRAGILRIDGTIAAGSEVQVIAFGLGAWTWAEAEAFAAAPRFDEPPPVVEIAFLEVAPGNTGSAYGDAPAGPIGVACISGSFEAPTVMLAGPFELAAP